MNLEERIIELEKEVAELKGKVSVLQDILSKRDYFTPYPYPVSTPYPSTTYPEPYPIWHTRSDNILNDGHSLTCKGLTGAGVTT